MQARAAALAAALEGPDPKPQWAWTIVDSVAGRCPWAVEAVRDIARDIAENAPVGEDVTVSMPVEHRTHALLSWLVQDPAAYNAAEAALAEAYEGGHTPTLGAVLRAAYAARLEVVVARLLAALSEGKE